MRLRGARARNLDVGGRQHVGQLDQLPIASHQRDIGSGEYSPIPVDWPVAPTAVTDAGHTDVLHPGLCGDLAVMRRRLRVRW